MTSAEQLIMWRRHLHRYPELSFAEHKTTAYIVEQLAGLPGVTLHTGKEAIGLETGVLATVGSGEAPVVGLRADIDALPVEEKTGAEYQSAHPGIMHACGHDGHTAMLLGAVQRLSEWRQNGTLKGTVKCLFQPAEETSDEQGLTGAQHVMASGILNDVSAMIALHLDPELPYKQIKLCSGIVMANVDSFSIMISGTGGHGAYPEQAVDPIWLTSLILPGLYGIPARKIAALEPAVLSIGRLEAGGSANVIPSQVRINGTIRTYSSAARTQMEAALRHVLESITPYGGSCQLSIEHGEPALRNAPEIVKLLEETARSVEPDIVIHRRPYGMGSEDFSHLAAHCPGAMLFLGAALPQRTALHQPTFDFNEEALELGTGILTEAALRLLIYKSLPEK
ncbi:M20 family metallopeptidase [Alkalihalobacillus oceani]|uniref:M20 metallopeptidase family protein n=1 Tax=Halalkalibacter oceani TaxID=1653776 RepID=UPI00203D98F4|nr:M20 family metallopeptidase [Halalkalibacter oceani]MCM3761302.1 M20 family metallopeptidase [Halalkalibacter oceani]